MVNEPPVKPMTPEDIVRRIAAECSYVDERGAVGIRLEPAAAIVRAYGEQCYQAASSRFSRQSARTVSAWQPALPLPESGTRSKSARPGG